MNFADKVAIAVNISVTAPGEFHHLEKMEFLKDSEIHLVHVFQTTTYAFGLALSEAALIYPIQEEREKLEQSILTSLKKIADQNMPESFNGTIHYHCLFSDIPKKAFCEFVDDKLINLILISSREKRGLFESSFAQYVAGHTKANLIILKHKTTP